MKKTHTTRLFWILYIFLLLPFVLFSIYHLIYANSAVPGVYINKIYVGGKKYSEIVKTLEESTNTSLKPASIVYKNTQYKIDPADIDISYNYSNTAKEALKYGRTGNFLADLK